MRTAAVAVLAALAVPASAAPDRYLGVLTESLQVGGPAFSTANANTQGTSFAAYGPGGSGTITTNPVGATRLESTLTQLAAAQSDGRTLTATATAYADAAQSFGASVTGEAELNARATARAWDRFTFDNAGAPAWVRATYTIATSQTVPIGAAATRVTGNASFGGGLWSYSFVDGDVAPYVDLRNVSMARNLTTTATGTGYVFSWEAPLAKGLNAFVADLAIAAECAGRFANPLCEASLLVSATFEVSRADIAAASTSGAVTFGVYDAGSTAAVPEPATWAMLIIGFAAVGAAARRQRGGRVPSA